MSDGIFFPPIFQGRGGFSGKGRVMTRQFTGDDVTYPVEMFLHVTEYMSRRGTSGEGDPVADLPAHVPDPAESQPAPSSVWKRGMEAGSLPWQEVKDDLIHRFGSSDYSLNERLVMLKSVSRRPAEDLWAYVVRVRCLTSATVDGHIPHRLEAGLFLLFKIKCCFLVAPSPGF